MRSITHTGEGSSSGLQPRPWRASAGITLVEVLVSIVLLGIGVGAVISGLIQANDRAAANRARNASLALCQERIDQVRASSFSPPTTIPSWMGTAWPIPATDTVTMTESVPICAGPNGVELVNGTRTTLASLADATLNLVRVTSRVSYSYRGRNFANETHTLLSPD